MKWMCFFTVAEVWGASSGKDLTGAAGVSQGGAGGCHSPGRCLCLYIRKISEIFALRLLSHAADGHCL